MLKVHFSRGTEFNTSHGKSVNVCSVSDVSPDLIPSSRTEEPCDPSGCSQHRSLVRSCHLFLEELDDICQDLLREPHWTKQPRKIKHLP